MSDETTIRLPATLADRLKLVATELARRAEFAGIDRNKSALMRVVIRAGMDAVENDAELPPTTPMIGPMVRFGLRVPNALADRLPAVRAALEADGAFGDLKVADVYRLVAALGVTCLERDILGTSTATGTHIGLGIIPNPGTVAGAAANMAERLYPTPPSPARKAAMRGEQLRVSFACRKGGTGKTMCSVGAASMVADNGYSVLLVDMDPQSNAAFGLGLDPGAPGIADKLLGRPAEPLPTAQANLFVLPGGPLLLQREVLECESLDLERVVKHLPFDVVIFDCPPGERRLETWALRSSQLVGIVLDHHDYAVMGAMRVMDQIEYFEQTQHHRPEVRMVLNKIDSRRRVDRDLAGRVREIWPAVPQISVRQDVRLSTATMEGTPFMLLSTPSRGPGFEDLRELAKWIVAGAKAIEKRSAVPAPTGGPAN